MTITSREAVRSAFDRAMQLHEDAGAAAQAVAQSLGLPIEAVLECIEESEAA